MVIGPGAPDPFIDLDGDGTVEIMASARNEHGDGRQCLVIFNADSGDRVCERPDMEVLAVDDLDGDDVPEALHKEKSCLKAKSEKTDNE